MRFSLIHDLLLAELHKVRNLGTRFLTFLRAVPSCMGERGKERKTEMENTFYIHALALSQNAVQCSKKKHNLL